MYYRLKSPVGEIAVVTDRTKRASEFLDVDAISVESHVINNHSGVAQFSLGLGGVDSTGKFHLDTSQEVVNLTVERKKSPFHTAQFDVNFRDENGNARHDYPRSFWDRLMRDTLIPAAYVQQWGAPDKFPNMEVVDATGATVFHPDQLKQKEDNSKK